MNKNNKSTVLRFAATLFILLTGLTDWADEEYAVTFISEYTSIPSIYAGTANYFTLNVENKSAVAGANLVADIFIGDELICEEGISSIAAGETATLNVSDPTIRPITENTVLNNDNANVTYKVVIKEGDAVKKQQEFSFVVLYNGNLGKDYSYPGLDSTQRVYSFTGDVQVLNKETDSYMGSSVTSRNEDFTVELDGGSVHKALLYVSYNWDKVVEGDFKTWTTTFNNNTVSPIASYRDQGNLGNYGNYGYGLVVYDVTDYVINGDNTFSLQKGSGNVSVYPSSLIVMTEKASAKRKTVYIVEQADLLSKNYNKNVDAICQSSFNGVTGNDAKLYVFAATAQTGEGDVIINDEANANVWSGTSSSVEVFEKSV
ncbi:MAG: DUF3344 domain-containing protein, partial [Paludibacteraceae bacterium]|nr:DUF3344 domain-containing protein [Paludibacteraceae bacterium]